MKRFMLLASLMILSNSLMANTDKCTVHSVTVLQHERSGLGNALEMILEQKGYKVIQDGQLYESEDVPTSELVIRPDLAAEGTLISTAQTFSAGMPCDVSRYLNKIYCSARFNLYQLDSNKRFKTIASINEKVGTELSYFKTEKSVRKKFLSNFIERALREIPECK